ncbi:class I SAM-dependent methyltransferase [Paraburkholderia hospita]|uniref:class I SAM-dependent methyltransferase n=1 Tax=Paraburkholderia hospita TaxID=169430 RepID=UPI0008A75CD0|nr:class I SAM-dependent methyltransferase [Paraburkholderia hospita]SEH89932.1 Methyltransferase domain-containing protein [Paraburkholderia hospita]
MKAPIDLHALEQATSLALADGHFLFHTHRLSPSDKAIAWALRAAMNPPKGAIVLDAGCGIGELSRLMSEDRPDLSFILANISEFQLGMCPCGPQFKWLHADCLDLPIVDEHVDAVMFVSALTQMDAKFVLHEAARVTKPGGIVFLAEMVREYGDIDEFEAVTTARVHTSDELEGFAAAAGLKLDFGCAIHDTDDSHFRKLLREVDRESLLDPIRFAIMRFIKE